MTEDAPARKRGRPATGQKPVRTVRIGPTWDEATALAEQRGERWADVLETLIRRWVQRNQPR